MGRYRVNNVVDAYVLSFTLQGIFFVALLWIFFQYPPLIVVIIGTIITLFFLPLSIYSVRVCFYYLKNPEEALKTYPPKERKQKKSRIKAITRITLILHLIITCTTLIILIFSYSQAFL